jgi:hypothetical protein
MNEREYRGDRSLGNEQSSPGPITSYEREMYGGGTGKYNDDVSFELSLEEISKRNEEFYRHFGGEIESVEDESSLVAEKPEVENLTPVEKLGEAVSRGAKALPAALGEEIKALFSPATLATMVGVFAVYIAAHATGIGQAVDIGMLIVGGIFFGLDAFTIFKDLAGFAGAMGATTEEELDIAGEHLASAIAKIGVDALMTLLTSKVADEIGKSIDHVNQVDEVSAHSDNVNPGRGNDVNNVNQNQGQVDHVNQVDEVTASSDNVNNLDEFNEIQSTVPKSTEQGRNRNLEKNEEINYNNEVIGHNISSTDSVMVNAPNKAQEALNKISEWTPKNKHLLSTKAKRAAKFNTNDPETIRKVLYEALTSSDAVFESNNDGYSFRVITDLGREIGTKGQTKIRVIVGPDSKEGYWKIWNAFPQN